MERRDELIKAADKHLKGKIDIFYEAKTPDYILYRDFFRHKFFSNFV